MSGSGESSASSGRDEFGFDLTNDDDAEEVDEFDEDDEDFDDDDLDDEGDGLLDEDELIDLDDEYDDTEETGKPHPGHHYDD